mgnify:CR=1 FL=1
MYKACIFDLDGTLTDTLDSLLFSVNEMMKELGLPEITREQCRMYVGNGAKVLVRKALESAGVREEEYFDKAFRTFQRIFDQNCTYHVRPYKGIVSLLAGLKAQGMKLGVLSNKPDRQAVHVVQEIFGDRAFDLVRGQREGVPRKPDPAALLEMADNLKSGLSEVIYIGDSEVDIKTGQAAGVKTILVSWGFRSTEDLIKAGAEQIVDSVQEIFEITKEESDE